MIVYIETNFVLECAYRQKHVEACESILSLSSRLELRLPAVCLGEPYFNYTERRRKNQAAVEQAQVVLGELSRSPRFAPRAEALREGLSTLITNANDLDKHHLDVVLAKTCEYVKLIPRAGRGISGR